MEALALVCEQRGLLVPDGLKAKKMAREMGRCGY